MTSERSATAMANERLTSVMSALLATILVVGVIVGGTGTASAQVDGLRVIEDAVYTVSESGVTVRSDYRVTNTTVDTREGNTIYYSYYEDFVVPVPMAARDVRVSSGGVDLTTSFEAMDDIDGELPDFHFVIATLPARLRSGETAEIVLAYTLPEGDLRSDDLIVTNPAFNGFPLWSNSDPGTGSVELRVPAGYTVRAFGEPLELVSTSGGIESWQPADFSDPTEWYTYVTVQNPSARDETTFSVSGQEIVLQSWPGDVEWSTFAEQTIRTGLPALESVIGTEVPDQSTLEVNESVDPYIYGFAGWYQLDDTSIQVGNELDDAVMIHELSHAWFNAGLFASRWIGEGLAEEYTWQAQELLGVETEPLPAQPSLDEEHAQRLEEWSDRQPTLEDADDFEEVDRWAYNASWWTMREIVDVAGRETMQAVIGAAIADEIAYLDGPAEAHRIDRDWRHFYDLVVERSATPVAVDAELDRLLRNLVVTPADLALLDDRAAARAEYAAFVDATAGWDVPLAVRVAMSEWDFDGARAEMSAATAVVDRHGEVAARAVAEGLNLSDAAVEQYEADPPDLDEALRILAAQDAAIDRVIDVRRAAAADSSFTTGWGLGDTDLDNFVADAEQAFAEDRFDAIEAAGADIERARAQAARDGRTRLIILTGLVLAALTTIYFVVNSRRTVAAPLALGPGDPIVRPTSSAPSSSTTAEPVEPVVPEVSRPEAERVRPPTPVPPPIPTSPAAAARERGPTQGPDTEN